jgi:hypothetical protein
MRPNEGRTSQRSAGAAMKKEWWALRMQARIEAEIR